MSIEKLDDDDEKVIFDISNILANNSPYHEAILKYVTKYNQINSKDFEPTYKLIERIARDQSEIS
jgi:hypothetical protein